MRVATTQTIGDDPGSQIDYRFCDLPGSRLRFRGPMPSPDQPYVAVLGGIETFGKYIAQPFPALLADWIGLPVANLGVAHAGLSLFSEEQVLLDMASRSEVTVLQVLGAQNMSNRLYGVHSRRNDRFLSVSPALRALFPQVDFTEINFTGHLLETLHTASEAAFQVLVDELKWAWVQRMRRILSIIAGDVVLLWVSIPAAANCTGAITHEEPQFVDSAMIDEIRNQLAGVVTVALSGNGSLDGKLFGKGEADAALHLPGLADHHRIAEALSPVVAELINAPGHTRSVARPQDQSFSIRSGTAVNRSATRP